MYTEKSPDGTVMYTVSVSRHAAGSTASCNFTPSLGPSLCRIAEAQFLRLPATWLDRDPLAASGRVSRRTRTVLSASPQQQQGSGRGGGPELIDCKRTFKVSGFPDAWNATDQEWVHDCSRQLWEETRCGTSERGADCNLEIYRFRQQIGLP